MCGVLQPIGRTFRFTRRLELFVQRWFEGEEDGLEDTIPFILFLAWNPPWHPSVRLEMHVQLPSRSGTAILRGSVCTSSPCILERRTPFRRCGRPCHAQPKGEGATEKRSNTIEKLAAEIPLRMLLMRIPLDPPRIPNGSLLKFTEALNKSNIFGK